MNSIKATKRLFILQDESCCGIFPSLNSNISTLHLILSASGEFVHVQISDYTALHLTRFVPSRYSHFVRELLVFRNKYATTPFWCERFADKKNLRKLAPPRPDAGAEAIIDNERQTLWNMQSTLQSFSSWSFVKSCNDTGAIFICPFQRRLCLLSNTLFFGDNCIEHSVMSPEPNLAYTSMSVFHCNRLPSWIVKVLSGMEQQQQQPAIRQGGDSEEELENVEYFQSREKVPNTGSLAYVVTPQKAHLFSKKQTARNESYIFNMCVPRCSPHCARSAEVASNRSKQLAPELSLLSTDSDTFLSATDSIVTTEYIDGTTYLMSNPVRAADNISAGRSGISKLSSLNHSSERNMETLLLAESVEVEAWIERSSRDLEMDTGEEACRLISSNSGKHHTASRQLNYNEGDLYASLENMLPGGEEAARSKFIKQTAEITVLTLAGDFFTLRWLERVDDNDNDNNFLREVSAKIHISFLTLAADTDLEENAAGDLIVYSGAGNAADSVSTIGISSSYLQRFRCYKRQANHLVAFREQLLVRSSALRLYEAQKIEALHSEETTSLVSTLDNFRSNFKQCVMKETDIVTLHTADARYLAIKKAASSTFSTKSTAPCVLEVERVRGVFSDRTILDFNPVTELFSALLPNGDSMLFTLEEYVQREGIFSILCDHPCNVTDQYVTAIGGSGGRNIVSNSVNIDNYNAVFTTETAMCAAAARVGIEASQLQTFGDITGRITTKSRVEIETMQLFHSARKLLAFLRYAKVPSNEAAREEYRRRDIESRSAAVAAALRSMRYVAQNRIRDGTLTPQEAIALTTRLEVELRLGHAATADNIFGDGIASSTSSSSSSSSLTVLNSPRTLQQHRTCSAARFITPNSHAQSNNSSGLVSPLSASYHQGSASHNAHTAVSERPTAIVTPEAPLSLPPQQKQLTLRQSAATLRIDNFEDAVKHSLRSSAAVRERNAMYFSQQQQDQYQHKHQQQQQ